MPHRRFLVDSTKIGHVGKVLWLVHVISLSRSLAEAVISLNIVQKPKKKASRQPLTCRLSQRVPRISHVLWPTGARHHRASAPVVGRGLTLLLVPQSPPCERPRTKCWLLGMVKSRASHRPRATTAARQPPTASRSPPRQRIAPPGCHCSSMLRAVSPPWRWPAHTRRPSRPSRRQLGLSLPPPLSGPTGLAVLRCRFPPPWGF